MADSMREKVDSLYWKIRKLSALSVAAASLASMIRCEDRTIGNVITLSEMAQEAAEEAERDADEVLAAFEK